LLPVRRPAVKALRLAQHQEAADRITQGMIGVVFVLLMLSAPTTELIGIHAMFGAFALGAVIPSESKLTRQMKEQLEAVLVVLLLPMFFALTGLRTRIELVTGMHAWLLSGLVILVACVGKFGGNSVAARWTGYNRRDAWELGILMNTRGMTELIVLKIGLQSRVIGPRWFAILAMMSLPHHRGHHSRHSLAQARREGRSTARRNRPQQASQTSGKSFAKMLEPHRQGAHDLRNC
jgi:Kef-type K+ transport system membrane component KefB